MTVVIVVCEGPTEVVFVKEILAPSLGRRSMFLHPRLIAKGGALWREQVLCFMRNTLRERYGDYVTYVTTFFDLYGLPADFPGRTEADRHTDAREKAKAVERTFHAEVVREANCRPERFFPHIQPYEFEALLFSDPACFAEEEPGWEQESRRLEAARQAAGGPEYVNDGPDTHPSARLKRHLRPGYRKVTHGLALSRRIGLGRIRAECLHFDRWVAHMETLADGAPPCPL